MLSRGHKVTALYSPDDVLHMSSHNVHARIQPKIKQTNLDTPPPSGYDKTRLHENSADFTNPVVARSVQICSRRGSVREQSFTRLVIIFFPEYNFLRCKELLYI